MTNKISILNHSHLKIPLRKRLHGLLLHLLEILEISDKELELVFLDDEQIRPYYLRYFGEDRPTDVIAFPLGEDSHLGCIVISVETARRQAREHRQSVWDEIRLLIVHGVLHLIGYDHAEAEEEKIMKSKEQGLLERTANIR